MGGLCYEKRNDDDGLMLDIYIGIGGFSSALRYWLFRAVEGRNERGRYGNIRFFGWYRRLCAFIPVCWTISRCTGAE